VRGDDDSKTNEAKTLERNKTIPDESLPFEFRGCEIKGGTATSWYRESPSGLRNRLPGQPAFKINLCAYCGDVREASDCEERR
jgi:hypothetical protein